MTVTNQKGEGVCAHTPFEGKELMIEGCGREGVRAINTQVTLTDCIVTNCRYSGIRSYDNGVIHLYGERTQVTRNCTSGSSSSYGLDAYSSSSAQIILHAPLTKESVSRNNRGGGNWGGGYGKIIERR